MVLMSVTSFDWSEVISSAISVKNKWGMSHFSTIASKSCRWALCHLSIPWRDADKRRVTLWANSEWVTLHGFSFGVEGRKDMPIETDSKCKKTLSSYSNKPKWIFLQIKKIHYDISTFTKPSEPIVAYHKLLMYLLSLLILKWNANFNFRCIKCCML